MFCIWIENSLFFSDSFFIQEGTIDHFQVEKKAFYKGKAQSEKREETQQITCLYLNSNIQKTHRNIFLSALQNKTTFQFSSLVYVSALKFQNSELRMLIKTKPNDKQE